MGKIIVTGGPTREWLDPVRFISNPSSGKMGVALADAAFAIAATTVFIHGPIDSARVAGKPYRCVPVDTTQQMHDAVIAELEPSSVLVMAAAPADYRAVSVADRKIKKSEGTVSVDFIKTVDILKSVAQFRMTHPQWKLFIAGFAAETHDVEQYARGKLADKNLDMICVNDVSKPGAGFASDTNEMILFFRGGERVDVPFAEKKKVAEIIMRAIIEKVDFL